MISVDSLWEYDRQYETAGVGAICGIDEAGRGPLAGPVYAAAVIFPRGLNIEGINDSKKLSEKNRASLYDQIISSAGAYCIACASEKEIDEINILRASLLAMRRAYDGLRQAAGIILIDGNNASGFETENALTIVGGDAKSAHIAAASILAKVARDRFMTALAEKYPGYLFEKHKGYPTKAHYEALYRLGPCPAHRVSFLRKFYENII